MDDDDKGALETRVDELEFRLRHLTYAMWVVGCCPRCGSRDVVGLEKCSPCAAWECRTCYARSIDDD